jgi:hypothetical protein
LQSSEIITNDCDFILFRKVIYNTTASFVPEGFANPGKVQLGSNTITTSADNKYCGAIAYGCNDSYLTDFDNSKFFTNITDLEKYVKSVLMEHKNWCASIIDTQDYTKDHKRYFGAYFRDGGSYENVAKATTTVQPNWQAAETYAKGKIKQGYTCEKHLYLVNGSLEYRTYTCNMLSSYWAYNAQIMRRFKKVGQTPSGSRNLSCYDWKTDDFDLSKIGN